MVLLLTATIRLTEKAACFLWQDYRGHALILARAKTDFSSYRHKPHVRMLHLNKLTKAVRRWQRICIYLKLRFPMVRITPQSKLPLKSCSYLDGPLRSSDSPSETNASQWLAIIAQGNGALESKGRNDTSARRRQQSYIDGERRLLVVQKMQVPPTLSLIASANYYSQRKQAIVLYPSFFTPGNFLPEMNVLYSGSNVFLLI